MRQGAIVALLIGLFGPAHAQAQVGGIILHCEAEGFAPLIYSVRRGDMRRYLANGWTDNLCHQPGGSCATSAEGVFFYAFDGGDGVFERFAWASADSSFEWEHEMTGGPVRGQCGLIEDPTAQ